MQLRWPLSVDGGWVGHRGESSGRGRKVRRMNSVTGTHLFPASLADAGRGRSIHLTLAHGWILFECCVVDVTEVGV